eukprot:31031-Pelagococcus_subviridis.AAC.6
MIAAYIGSKRLSLLLEDKRSVAVIVTYAARVSVRAVARVRAAVRPSPSFFSPTLSSLSVIFYFLFFSSPSVVVSVISRHAACAAATRATTTRNGEHDTWSIFAPLDARSWKNVMLRGSPPCSPHTLRVIPGTNNNVHPSIERGHGSSVETEGVVTLFARVRRLWRPRRTARRERRRRARRSSRTDRPEVSRVEDTRAGTSRRRPWSIQTSSARSGTRKKSFLVRKTEAGRAGSGLDASPTCVRSFVPKEKNAAPASTSSVPSNAARGTSIMTPISNGASSSPSRSRRTSRAVSSIASR